MASGAQKKKSSLGLIIFLLILLVVGIFFLVPSYNIRTNTATQTTTENQCPQTGQSFDAQQEAFTLAQSAEQYRQIKPYNGNYGLGSYIICLTNGAMRRIQSMPFQGYYDRSLPYYQQHLTHSEQATYKWLQDQLSRLSLSRNLNKVAAIYVVIFSQVLVCTSCQRDMIDWQRTLRQKAKVENLYLSVWDIMLGKGFVPTVYPAGTGIPVSIDDLEEVNIPFAP